MGRDCVLEQCSIETEQPMTGYTMILKETLTLPGFEWVKEVKSRLKNVYHRQVTSLARSYKINRAGQVLARACPSLAP